MATTPTPSPAPPTKLQNIEAIILAALQGLSMIPVIGGTASIIGVLANILVKAQGVYQQETGLPYDLSKVPLETPVA
jgi:hypothetical protein